jgi:hypothetical protein
MEFSTNDIAIALRFGATDVAIELVQDSMQESMQQSFVDRIRKGEMVGTYPHLAEEEILMPDHKAYVNVFLAWLDADANHALHYAVYYEDNEMVSYLTHQTRRLGYFAEYITSTSKRGSNIMDFLVGYSNSGFNSRVEAFYEEGRKTMQQKEEAEVRANSTTLSLLYCFQQLRQHTNLGPAFFSAYGILLGKYIFAADGTRQCWSFFVPDAWNTKSEFRTMGCMVSWSHPIAGAFVPRICIVSLTWKLFPWWLVHSCGWIFSLPHRDPVCSFYGIPRLFRHYQPCSQAVQLLCATTDESTLARDGRRHCHE